MASAKSARPTSASSRTAWGDYGHARPDSQFDFGQEGIRNDADLSPTAMADDAIYDDKAKPSANGRSSAVVPKKKSSNKSCFGKIGSGIRCKWLYFLIFQNRLKAEKLFFYAWNTTIVFVILIILVMIMFLFIIW